MVQIAQIREAIVGKGPIGCVLPCMSHNPIDHGSLEASSCPWYEIPPADLLYMDCSAGTLFLCLEHESGNGIVERSIESER